MSQIARRHFLATSSALAAPLASVGTAAQAASHPAHTAPWQLLAVAPLSEKIPTLNADYRAGVALGLAQHPLARVQLHWVDAPALPSAATRRIAAALEQHPDVHGVMGWMPPELERRVAELTHARGLPLWVSDTGADRRLPTSTPRPRADHYHSLGLCEAAEALAHQVFDQLGPRAVLAMGWMESGYDFVAAFHHTYRTLGGQVLGRHVGGPVPQAHEFDGLKREVFAHRPDAVVAFYAGPQANRFVQWWQAHAHRQGNWQLAGLPWLAEAGAPRDALIARPWPHAQHARSDWREHFAHRHTPWSAAAVLGAEAGFRMGSSLHGLGKHPEPTALQLAWRGARDQHMGPLGGWPEALQPRMPSPRLHAQTLAAASAHSGWLSGYLQT